MTSALTGMRTLDVGAPQLSMHSCRECMGTEDVVHAVKHFRAAFVHYADVDASFSALPDAGGAAQERARKRRRGE